MPVADPGFPGGMGRQLAGWLSKLIITGRNEVVAKVIFLHLSVILFTGGVSASVHAGITPPEQTPHQSRHLLGYPMDTPITIKAEAKP